MVDFEKDVDRNRYKELQFNSETSIGSNKVCYCQIGQDKIAIPPLHLFLMMVNVYVAAFFVMGRRIGITSAFHYDVPKKDTLMRTYKALWCATQFFVANRSPAGPLLFRGCYPNLPTVR